MHCAVMINRQSLDGKKTRDMVMGADLLQRWYLLPAYLLGIMAAAVKNTAGRQFDGGWDFAF